MGFNMQLACAMQAESVPAIDDAIREIARQEFKQMIGRAAPEHAAELFALGVEIGGRDARAALEVEKAASAAIRQRMEDLKLILRCALQCDRDGDWIQYGPLDGTLFPGETEDGDPIEVRVAMDDGLPCLDAVSRAAIVAALSPARVAPETEEKR